MRFGKFFIAPLVAALALSSASPVLAEGKAVGKGLQDLAEALSQDSVGKLISGVIYGNTSNGPGVPSNAPGPWKCSGAPGCEGSTDPGGSMGEFIAPLTSGTASPDFANSKDPGPDFSAH